MEFYIHTWYVYGVEMYKLVVYMWLYIHDAMEILQSSYQPSIYGALSF